MFFFYNNINKFMEVYSLPCLKKKKFIFIITSFHCIYKEFNIPPLSAKCAIAQVRCFIKNGKTPIVLSLFNYVIYHVVAVMYGIKKVKF